MSKQQDKKNSNILEHAEFLWEQAQLSAASANNTLGGAEQIYNAQKHEMTEEQQKATDEQIALRREEIKNYLESEKALYLERLGQIKSAE